MKYYFCILALNEEKHLENTFQELKDVILESQIEDFKIIIYDDGSTDRTKEIANKIKFEEDLNIEVISHKFNIGPAKTIKKFIENHKEGKFLVISGDNDLDKKLIKDLIIASKKADFVLSYYLNREKKGWFRANLSTTLNLILCTLFNVYVFYLQGPFVWPLDKVSKFKINSTGIAYACEVNIKLLHSDLKFIEVSGIMNTGSENSTSIKIKNFFDILRTIIFLLIDIKIKKTMFKKSKRIY